MSTQIRSKERTELYLVRRDARALNGVNSPRRTEPRLRLFLIAMIASVLSAWAVVLVAKKAAEPIRVLRYDARTGQQWWEVRR